MSRNRPSAGREARLAARASAELSRAALEAAGAAVGAQSVIAHRMALMAAAACGLRPAGHPELSRMMVEKLEAALAAGPAVLSFWAGMQMQLLQIWQREVRIAARMLGWGSAPGPQAMARIFDHAAARSRAAALGMVTANTAAMVPVLDPYYGRIRRNARRLARAGLGGSAAPRVKSARSRRKRS